MTTDVHLLTSLRLSSPLPLTFDCFQVFFMSLVSCSFTVQYLHMDLFFTSGFRLTVLPKFVFHQFSKIFSHYIFEYCPISIFPPTLYIWDSLEIWSTFFILISMTQLHIFNFCISLCCILDNFLWVTYFSNSSSVKSILPSNVQSPGNKG